MIIRSYLPWLFVMAVMMVSCSPKISTSISNNLGPLKYDENVIVYDMNTPKPQNSQMLGVVKIGDSGFSTNCDYGVVVDKAKMEARKVGGNAIKIIEHKLPSAFGSSCHRITAEILFVDENALKELQNEEAKSEEKLDVDYAILYIYRLGGAGALVNYDVYLGNDILCRVGNKTRYKIKVKKEGLNSIWAKTESKAEIPVKIEMGREYFIRCGIGMGIMVGRPVLQVVDKGLGLSEYKSIKAEKDVVFRKDGSRIECEILKEDDVYVYVKMMLRDRAVNTQIPKEQIDEIEYAN